MMTMQDAANILHDMFPGKTVTLTREYNSNCPIQWFYTAHIYNVDKDRVYHSVVCSYDQPTIEDAVNAIRQQVEAKLWREAA